MLVAMEQCCIDSLSVQNAMSLFHDILAQAVHHWLGDNIVVLHVPKIVSDVCSNTCTR